jgi:mRNA interferase RelE/StbE
MYRLISKKSVIKFIEKRVPKEKFVIEEKLKVLKLNPYPNDFLDIKKLSNSEYYIIQKVRYNHLLKAGVWNESFTDWCERIYRKKAKKCTKKSRGDGAKGFCKK